MAQLVQRLATGWTVRGSNPYWARFSAPVQTGPEAHTASFTMGTRVFFLSGVGGASLTRPERDVDHSPRISNLLICDIVGPVAQSV